jgi:hypothetical protein
LRRSGWGKKLSLLSSYSVQGTLHAIKLNLHNNLTSYT